jgi:DUF4097 and DUF4098 domain-containing protein YvlB
MKKSTIVSLVLFTTFFSQGLFAYDWGSDEFSKTVQLALDNDSLDQLNIDAGAGDLKITGKPSQSEITVIAKVFGEKLSDDDYVLSLEKAADKALLIAQFNDNTYNNERIDLEISMPSYLALLVDDRSGDISIESVSNGLTLNDRSGDIELSHIAGLVRIEDRSGDVVGKDLRGDVIINDRSGEIYLKDVVGDVNIDDSSGDIHATNISGVVTVEDGSGDININGAADFRLINAGSGDVSLQNIKKNLK